MDREEILLKEYETCQSHNNSLGQQAWVSISIIITINILAIVQVIYNVILKTTPTSGFDELILVILIGLVMILILVIFYRWDKRIDFMVLVNNERMRQIETTLKMWKNWRVYGLDLKYGFGREEDSRTLLETQIKYFDHLSQRYPNLGKEKLYIPPSDKGWFKFNCIFPILISLWGVVVILEASIYWCPFMQRILLN